ncbi:hypothetical protein DL765_009235 [Monosporascus sp. GIB2]|nr:hypothetical protein DL765_009235 [Monosporascus sp. GIB2]
MKSILPFLVGNGLSLIVPAPSTRAEHLDLVPLDEPEDRDSIVRDRYMIALEEHAQLSDHWEAIGQDLSKDSDACGDYRYLANIKVYFCTIKDKDLLDERVRGDTDNVHSVAVDAIFPLEDDFEDAQPLDESIIKRWDRARRLGPWYLQQMTARGKLPPNGPGEAPVDHMKNPLPGEGVNIYILDSGINREHNAFYSGPNFRLPHRVVNFKGLGDEDKSPFSRNSDENMNKMTDTWGHGTAVASVAASWRYGIAPGATVVNVKVAPTDSGMHFEGLTLAIDAIVEEHKQNAEKVPRPRISGSEFKGSVISISGRIMEWAGLERALQFAYKNGIPIAASAGNMNTNVDDLQNKYPCAYDQVMCVGSSDHLYKRFTQNESKGSNYGMAVNVFAPGSSIRAAHFRVPTGSVMGEGTSYSTAFVAGMMATILSYEGFESFDYAEGIYERIQANFLNGVLEDIPEGTQNAFLTTGINHVNRLETCPYAGLTNDQCIAINNGEEKGDEDDEKES